MGKKHMMAGREYETISNSVRSCADIEGQGVFIERSWGRHGSLFSWSVNRSWGHGYATGQASSWDAAAVDAHAALEMMVAGHAPPLAKLAAGLYRR